MPNATYDRYYESQPQLIEDDSTPTWITRGRNFVVVISQTRVRALLVRDSISESMLILPPGVSARLEIGDETLNVGADSLTILPPGHSKIEFTGTGPVVRVFTTAEKDLLAAASNRETYADVPHLAAPIGEKTRRLFHYPLADFPDMDNPAAPMRIFRSQHLMVNIFTPSAAPRDLHRLTPHSHPDFEQGSLALAGTFTHHLRYPWGPDFEGWRDDEHVTMSSPSLVVIPETVIHTTANATGQQDRLVDIFSPPRADFLAKPGYVCNAADFATSPVGD